MQDKREKEIFLQAIEIESPEARSLLIRQMCVGDDDLRCSVERLLKAQDKSASWLDGNGDSPDRLGQQARWIAAALSDTAVGSIATNIDDRTGETIGDFRLMEKLGEGGFGEVYVAQQQKPVRRQVAIKLLKPGLASKEILARFEAERQALALMNHPHIAQVFEAGTTSQGQPFIAMELVRGIPITTFCRNKDLSLAERLSLFADVCSAVHHAHQKGVIHRDLKPSNVLVTIYDTAAVAKVIDFGVAKAINEPLTEKTIYTRFAQIIGTPMYMSPEQVEMNALDVDTRSDIYSLGVLLYELLTDAHPFDEMRMRSASFDEMRKMIREEEPPRPSTRLTTATGANGKTDVSAVARGRELANRLRGDLDWIVMKAIDKDRRRRYETAADLARDVQRYLNGQPVIARPPSHWYRLTKFARRNKLFLTATALVLLSLITGTTVSTILAIRATRAQHEADRLRKEAVDFAQQLKDANILLVSGRANADQGRLSQAYQDYTRATQLMPDHFLTWAGRGSLLASLGAWNVAASDYATAVRLGASPSDPSWWGVPHLFLYAGERELYASLCQTLNADLGRTEDVAVLTIACRSICLEAIDTSRAQALAERFEQLLRRGPALPRHTNRSFVARPPGSPPPGPPQQGPDDHGPLFGFPHELIEHSTALAQFRAGNLERARSLLEPLTNGTNRRFTGAIQLSRPLLALVYERLGESDAARRMLSEAMKVDQQWTDQLGDRLQPLPWFDGLESRLFLAEASLAITSKPLDRGPLQQKELQLLSQLGQLK